MSELDDYISAHISPEPPLLQKVYRDTYLHTTYPQMCSGHVQGRLLKMLTQMINPQCILELGTFTGYATLCMAEGMSDTAQLHTIEIDDESAETLEATFGASPWADRIHLHIGDALQVIDQLPLKFDMAYIDANKRHYCEYYEMLMPRITDGGYMLIDNTLWYSKVIDEKANDPQTLGIRRFNDLVAHDPRVEVAMLPVRDGLTLLHKLPEPLH